MITTYSKPTKAHIWSYFVGPIRFLAIVAIIGNVVSGVTELGILKRLIGDVLGTVAAVALAFLLALAIELVYSIFCTMASKSWFEIVRINRAGTSEEKQDVSKLLYIAVFSTVISVLVIILSIGISTEGKTDLVNDMVTMPDSLKVDATLATQMTTTAALKLGSDTMSINANALKTINNENARVMGLIASKRSRITQLKSQFNSYPNSTWYPKQIKANETSVSTLDGNLKDFRGQVEAERRAAVNEAIAAYLSTAASAGDTLTNVITKTQADNTTLFDEANRRKGKIQNVATWFVVGGIFSRLIYAFVMYLGYYLSGRKPEHVENEADFTISNWSQFKEGLKAHWYNWMNAIVVGIVGKEIELRDGGILIKKNDNQAAKEAALAQAEKELLEKEKEALETQQQQASEKQRLQQEKEALEAEKAKLKAAAERRKIETETERKRLQQERAAELNSLKRQKEQELRQAKKEQEKQLRKQILEEQKQILETERKQIEAEKQHLSKQKQIAETAKQVADEKAKLQEQKQVLETDLETSLKQMETVLETDGQSESVGKQEDLVIWFNKQYQAKIRNWYWASKGLKGRGKTETTRKQNQVKYESAKKQVEKLGVKVVEKSNTILFELP